MKIQSKKPRIRVRGWWLIAAALLIAGAWAYTEWASPRENAGAPPPAESLAPVSAATPAPTDDRTAREMGYDKDIAALTALIEAERTDAQTRADAAARLERLVGQHQTELAIESALESAGFSPKLVICQNGSLTVMLGLPELTGADSAAVLALCAAHADVALENVRVMAGAQ